MKGFLGATVGSRPASAATTPNAALSRIIDEEGALYGATEQKGGESLLGLAELPWGSADHALATAARVRSSSAGPSRRRRRGGRSR